MKASIDGPKAKDIISKYYRDERGKDVEVFIYPIKGDDRYSDSALIEIKDYINIAGNTIELSDYIGDDELITIMSHYFDDHIVESISRTLEYEKDEYLMYYNKNLKYPVLEIIMYPKKLNQDIDKKPNVKRK